jgi:hypothetical protein
MAWSVVGGGSADIGVSPRRGRCSISDGRFSADCHGFDLLACPVLRSHRHRGDDHGLGLQPTGNAIRFGIGGTIDVLSHQNGAVLDFTIPEYIGPCS